MLDLIIFFHAFRERMALTAQRVIEESLVLQVTLVNAVTPEKRVILELSGMASKEIT